MPDIQGTMTGVIAEILVNENEAVDAGQDVLILESMKMHIPIQATEDGVVKEIKGNKGDLIKPGQVLVVLK